MIPAQIGERMRLSGPTFIVLLALFVVTACEPALRPFRPHDKSIENPLLQLTASAGLVITPTLGLAPGVSERLAEAVAVALGRLDLPASTDTARSDAILVESQAVISETAGSSEMLIIHWTLSDPRLAVAGSYDTRMQIDHDQLSSGTPALLEQIADATAHGIARLIQENQPQRVAAPRPLTLAIAGIDGAFRDDNQTLLLAFRTVLEEAGVPIVDDPANATAILRGTIEVSGAEADRQQIVIVWTLSEAGGRTVGTLRQDNTVKQGELTGRWDELVYDIAFAAADAIVEILKQIDAAEQFHRIGSEETLQ